MKKTTKSKHLPEAHFYLNGKKLEGVTSIDLEVGEVEMEELVQEPGCQPTKRKRVLKEGTLIVYLHGN